MANNKQATQSTTHTTLNSDAKYAVDGNTSTCTRTYEIGPQSPDKTVWWKVDMGESFRIFSINIIFKNYDGQGK